jgi:hypothetical protein
VVLVTIAVTFVTGVVVACAIITACLPEVEREVR